MQVARIPRETFLGEHFDYQPGEHVSFIEPTQGGKTHLAYQCLDAAMERWPHLRVVSLMPKSRDPATAAWAKRLDMKVIDGWPPPKTWFGDKPRGYVLWPKHLKGAAPEVNRAHLAGIFRRCLADQFRQGNAITLCDDVYLAAVLLGLNADLEEHWTAGSGGGCGLWSTNQKPSGTIGGGAVSSFLYNSPSHLFLGHDPDARNIKRFSEIGGVDPRLVAETVTGLGIIRVQTPGGIKNISEKLYISKAGPYLAIIGP
jgi:hypothetical protein